MMSPRSIPVFFGLFGAAAIASASSLSWSRTEARVELEPDQQEARELFKLTNKGSDPVRVSRIETSCGCTGSIVKNRLIDPGEAAEIVATFHAGKRVGTVTNKLDVYLDGRGEPIATLRLVAKIPQLVELEPQVLFWKASEDASARTVRIRLDERYVDTIQDVKYDTSVFDIRVVKEGEEGDSGPRLEVAPASRDPSKARGMIEVVATGPEGHKATGRAHAFVRP